MSEYVWDAPRTEEGFQKILLQLQRCRAEGNDVEIGNGLLALSYLVKWVRSDTEASPFVRAHELSLEALEIFRRAENANGQIRALINATVMADPKTREEMLAEAENLAERTGDENIVASVLAAKARKLGLSDRPQAEVLQQRVLAIYRRTGNKAGQANSLFSLSILEGTSEQKRDYALEAASLYREMGDYGQAARTMSIALMNATEIQPLVELEDLVRQGLQNALDSGEHCLEERFYNDLAFISAAKGQVEEAAKYRRWAQDIQDSDGLTPLERWKEDIEMTKMIISMSKVSGSKDAVDTFKMELKRLKASKPKP